MLKAACKGRCAMKKTKAISVTLPYKLAEQLEKESRVEDKTVSFIVSEAVRVHLNMEKWEKLREDFSEHAGKKGIVTEEDIDRIIHEYRDEEKARKNHG
jgi:metal-responsive CopG/Arc/MetJ family transcriptional regulator